MPKFKRIFAAMIGTAISASVLLIMPFSVFADTMLFPNTSSFSAMECEDFTYEINDGDIKITGYNGASGNIVIPDEIDGYQVTSIGYRAFLYTSVKPESVILPEGLKSIEDEAFIGIAGYGFYNITIPKSVEVIGSKAFGYSFNNSVGNYEYCEKLKNTIIKGYVGSVAETYATKNGFTFIALDESLSTSTTQTAQTTSASTPLTTLSSAKSQTYGNLTYMNYGGWIEITDCSTDVETVEIPEKIDNTTVRDIGDNAFSGCSALIQITIPDTVKTIGASAFNGCSSLKSIELPVRLQKIGFNAFYSCTNLSSIEIPNSVTTIEGFAFNNCSGLKTITIPTNVETIGNRAFYDCKSLTEILAADGNESFSSKDGVLYNSDFTKIICYPAGKSDENYTVADSVTIIGDAAFYNCRGLTEIILPDKLTTIEDFAFYYCSGIQTVILPSTVQSIGQASFYGCTKMTDIYIPKSITIIPVGAFSQCIALSDVYYSGSESDWNAIEIDNSMNMNSYLKEANVHYNSEGIVKQIQGDVNDDGVFSVADVLLFQKWLLSVPDANLANWKAADLCEDGRLNVFDLCLMKLELISNLSSVDA